MTNLIIDNSLQRIADPQTPYFVGDVYVLLKKGEKYYPHWGCYINFPWTKEIKFLMVTFFINFPLTKGIKIRMFTLS